VSRGTVGNVGSRCTTVNTVRESGSVVHLVPPRARTTVTGKRYMSSHKGHASDAFRVAMSTSTSAAPGFSTVIARARRTMGISGEIWTEKKGNAKWFFF